MSFSAPYRSESDVMRMPDLQTFHARQCSFGEALLNAGLPAPEGVIGRDGKPSERRFNVYRNNVVTGQVATLCDAYPATARLVGDAFFRAMARDYVLAHVPTTPMMFDYGADFPAFIDVFPEAQELPYLGDVARIERAWVEAYHAPEALPLSGLGLRDVLAASDPGSLTLQLHPSMRVLQSPFPALSIWEMNTGSSREESIGLDDGPEEMLVVRPEADVHVHRLTKGSAAFLMTVAKGFSLVNATEQAIARNASFDLVAHLAALVDARLVIGSRPARKNSNLIGA